MQAHQLVSPGRLEPVETASPSEAYVEDGSVVVRVHAAAVCGSDIPNFARGGPIDGAPTIGYPLHEITGKVVASSSAGLSPGDMVVGWASRSDALAELISTDGDGLARCDSHMPAWQTIVAQPLACVLYAVDRLPPLRGASAAVFGLGPIGLLFSHVMRTRGVKTLTGVDPVDRADVARSFGVSHVEFATSQEWVQNLGQAPRPGIVIEAVGHQAGTLRDALAAAAFGGTVYAFGIPHPDDYPIKMSELVRKNLTLAGGVTTSRRAYLVEALKYLSDFPELSTVVTHVLLKREAQKAFELASQPRSGQLKIVLVDETVTGGADA